MYFYKAFEKKLLLISVFYSATNWLFRFGLGFRINSPKFVNQQFDRIDQILK